MSMIYTANAAQVRGQEYSADASDLGLPPGYFPASMSTDLGDGTPFVYNNAVKLDDIISVAYVQPSTGTRLIVFND